MPYVMKPSKLFVKDPNGNGYLPQNVVSDSDDSAVKLPAPPTADGAYVLTVTVTDGESEYSWESTST